MESTVEREHSEKMTIYDDGLESDHEFADEELYGEVESEHGEEENELGVDAKRQRVMDEYGTSSHPEPDQESSKELKSSGERRHPANKVMALVDLDCFYVAVERMLDPTLVGVPVGVAQYTQSDTLIAISYEAKHAGVKRGMFGFEARKICPNIRIVKVRVKNDKADLTNYRDASAKVLEVAGRHCAIIERASVDEFYLDLTNEARKRLDAARATNIPIEWARTTLFCTEYDTVQELPEALSNGDNKPGHLVVPGETGAASLEKSTNAVDDSIGAIDRSTVSALSLEQMANSKDPSSKDVDDAQNATSVVDAKQSDENTKTVDPQTIDNEEDALLAMGNQIILELRTAVKTELGLDCSAGIASNRFLAKSIAGIRKPATQIVLRPKYVETLCRTMPLHRARSLGGKLGDHLKDSIGVEFLFGLVELGEPRLSQLFGPKEGKRLFHLGQGLDDTPVIPRTLPKSIGCSKQFPGKQVLLTRAVVSEWLTKLCSEVVERFEKDGRRPTTVTVHAYSFGSRSTSNFNTSRITQDSLISVVESLFDRLVEPGDIAKRGGVRALGVGLSGFPEDKPGGKTLLAWTRTKKSTEGETHIFDAENKNSIQPDGTAKFEGIHNERANETTRKGFPTESLDNALVDSSSPSTNWTCIRCTYHNTLQWLRCEACGTSKSGTANRNVKRSDASSLLGISLSKVAPSEAKGDATRKLVQQVLRVDPSVEPRMNAKDRNSVLMIDLDDSDQNLHVLPSATTTISKCDDDDVVVLDCIGGELDDVVEAKEKKYAGETKSAKGQWECRRCTFAENDARFLRCEVCGSSKI